MMNICSQNILKSKAFYTTLFDLTVAYDSDWFIHLTSQDGKLELGIIDQTNEIVPLAARANPQGFYITFVVEDVEKSFQIALENEFEVVGEPIDTFYGQRRLLLKDPDGTMVDISAPIRDFNP